MSKEIPQELTPTDEVINFLDSIKDNRVQWGIIKTTMILSNSWEISCKECGIDIERVRDKANEIELNKNRGY
jgi:hypothetical protein